MFTKNIIVCGKRFGKIGLEKDGGMRHWTCISVEYHTFHWCFDHFWILVQWSWNIVWGVSFGCWLQISTQNFHSCTAWYQNWPFPTLLCLFSKRSLSQNGCHGNQETSIFNFFLTKCRVCVYRKGHQVSRKKILSFQSYPIKTKRREESAPLEVFLG